MLNVRSHNLEAFEAVKRIRERNMGVGQRTLADRIVNRPYVKFIGSDLDDAIRAGSNPPATVYGWIRRIDADRKAQELLATPKGRRRSRRSAFAGA